MGQGENSKPLTCKGFHVCDNVGLVRIGQSLYILSHGDAVTTAQQMFHSSLRFVSDTMFSHPQPIPIPL